jgi:hypothetical protein
LSWKWKCSFIHSFVRAQYIKQFIVKSYFDLRFAYIHLYDLRCRNRRTHRKKERKKPWFILRLPAIAIKAGYFIYDITVFFQTCSSPKILQIIRQMNTANFQISILSFFITLSIFFNFALSVSHFFSSFKLHFVFHSPRNVLFLDTFRMYVFIWRNFALSTLVDFWVEFSLQTSLFNLLACLLALYTTTTITSLIVRSFCVWCCSLLILKILAFFTLTAESLYVVLSEITYTFFSFSILTFLF